MIGLTLIGSKSKRRNEAGFKDSRVHGFEYPFSKDLLILKLSYMKQRCSPTKFEFFVIASLTTWTLEPLNPTYSSTHSLRGRGPYSLDGMERELINVRKEG
jgi:hypothetical protein